MSLSLHKAWGLGLIVLTKVLTTTNVLTKTSERGFSKENLRLYPLGLICSVPFEHVPTQVVTLFVRNHTRNRASCLYLSKLRKRRKRERDDDISEGAAASSMMHL